MLYHGYGEFVWSKKEKYKGNWMNNEMDGKGVYTDKHGKKYDGYFRNGMKHGHFTFKNRKGQVSSVWEYADDKVIKKTKK